MTRSIPLTKGLIALVDDELFEELSQHKWTASDGYAIRMIRNEENKPKMIYMHRQIMNAPAGMEVDHRNGLRGDNQRANLRLATHAQNRMNTPKDRLPNATSKYRGVFWCNTRQRWVAQIMINGKNYHLGCFTDEYQAAQAREAGARELFGEFAHSEETP